MNDQTHVSQFQTAGLIISPNAGEVRQGKQSIRLSPVNMRVLMVLIEHAGKTVTRQEIFDQVWPNQVVSDDALTRAIADLRSQLKPLSSESSLIKTRPKVGYSWQPEVKPVSADNNQKNKWWQPLLGYVALFILAVVLVYGFLSWQLKTEPVALVILPTETNQPNWSVDKALQQAVLKTDKLNYLSDHAFYAHKGNPYPYFSHEFGVRWFIESKLDNNALTLQLVDARTALVIYSEEHSIENNDELTRKAREFIQFVAEL